MEILLQIGILTAILSVVCPLAPKNSDEGRPYEFGFTIDGQQHRHEKKDERGIIQGEFGFITADGIYHVTVYATDENGNFKILSMRNIRISAPLDGSPFKGEISPEAKKYLKQDNNPSSPAPQFQEPNPLSLSQPDPLQGVGTKKNTKLPQLTTQPTIKAACASCGLISTPKPQPSKTPLPKNQDVSAIHSSPYVLNQYENTANIPVPDNLADAKYSEKEEQDKIVKQFATHNGQTLENRPITAGQNVQYQSSQFSDKISHKIHEYQPAVGPQTTNYKNFGNSQNRESGLGVNDNSNHETNAENQSIQQIPTYEEGNYKTGDEHKPEFSKDFNINYEISNQSRELAMGTGGNTTNGDSVLPHASNSDSRASIGDSIMITGQEPNPLQLPNDRPASVVSTLPPISVADGVIHVGGNIKQDIYIKDKFPGMQEGLPAGIKENDITNLLYKFHYTVGFHGHYEKGLKDGTKIGGYFVNGRDGISRVVTYIADENGYRPKVKFINLGLESEDTPKPETEKTFGLKSFEFVWYPLS